ncbi:MAG: hypothetical protein ACI4PC_02610 [Oscillospiraceae bacterium]
MKRSTEILNGLSALLFHVALTGWFFCLSILNVDFTAMSLPYALLFLAAAAAYGLNRLMVNRGVPAPLFVAAQALMVGAGAWLFVSTLRLEPYSLSTAIICCVIYCCAFPTSAFLAYYGVGKNGMLLRFDLLAIMMILLLLLSYYRTMPAFSSTLVLCGVALAAAVLSQIAERAGRYSAAGSSVQGSAAGGRVMLAAAIVFLLLLTGVIVLLAFGGLESVSHFFAELISAIVNGVKTALVFLYGQLERLMRWLASQMGDDDPMEAGLGMQGGAATDVDYGEGELALPAWLGYAAIAVAAILFVWILFRLRRGGVKRMGRRTVRRRVRTKRESGLSLALAGLFAGLKGKLLYRVNCVRYRKTAPGLLAWCEKKAGGELGRRAGESGEQFLLRLAQSRDGDGEAPALRSLAEAVERSFYSPGPAPVSRELYAAVRKLKFT